MKKLIPLILVLAFFSPVLCADELDTYRKMIEQQKKHQDQFLARLEPLPGPKRRLDQIFSFALKDGKLVLKAALLESNEQRLRSRQLRVDVEGFASPCMVMAHQLGGANRENWYFTFSNTDYPKMEGVATLSINAQPAYINVSRNHNSKTRNYNVNFTQSNGRAQFGQPDGVQLAVFASDNSGRQTTNLNLAETDFVTLRRKNPAAVREHLRPLFRDLHLENLFAVETITGWQVFSDRWPGDQTLAREIKQRIPSLDDDTYQQRDEATTALRKLGPYAALCIYLMPRDGMSMEQNTRLDSVVASHGFLSHAEARRLRTDPDFLLDCLYCEDSQIRHLAHRHLCDAIKRDVAFNPDGAPRERELRIEEIRAEISGAAKPTTAPAPMR